MPRSTRRSHRPWCHLADPTVNVLSLFAAARYDILDFYSSCGGVPELFGRRHVEELHDSVEGYRCDLEVPLFSLCPSSSSLVSYSPRTPTHRIVSPSSWKRSARTPSFRPSLTVSRRLLRPKPREPVCRLWSARLTSATLGQIASVVCRYRRLRSHERSPLASVSATVRKPLHKAALPLALPLALVFAELCTPIRWADPRLRTPRRTLA